MSSDFPKSPKILKGALVMYKSHFVGTTPNIIVFQYNPDQLSRSISNRMETTDKKDVGKAKSESYRTTGPPVETIEITVTIDAADQLEKPRNHQTVLTKGIHPALAALELLMYPTVDQFIKDNKLAEAGSTQLTTGDVPLVLFVWGPNRVMPVRLTSFSVTEQAFDQKLNPIRAEVRLGMTVLNYLDLEKESIGHGAYIAMQSQKESMAQLHMKNKDEQISGLLPV